MSAEIVITTLHTVLNFIGLGLALAAAATAASLMRSVARHK